MNEAQTGGHRRHGPYRPHATATSDRAIPLIGTIAVRGSDSYEVHIGTGRSLIRWGWGVLLLITTTEAREASEERHIGMHRGTSTCPRRASSRSSRGRRRMHVIRCHHPYLWSSRGGGRDVVRCTIPIASHQHTLTFIGPTPRLLLLLLLLLLLRMGHFVVMTLVFAIVKRDDDARENQNAENEQRRWEQRRWTEPFLFQQILHHRETHTDREDTDTDS